MWCMIANIAFYWILLFICELKIFGKIFCRKRSAVINEEFDSVEFDLEIKKEAKRVLRINPQ